MYRTIEAVAVATVEAEVVGHSGSRWGSKLEGLFRPWMPHDPAGSVLHRYKMLVIQKPAHPTPKQQSKWILTEEYTSGLGLTVDRWTLLSY